jgi:hypothetical protein
MNIKHAPVFDQKKAKSYLENKDGVVIDYVCTTDLGESDVPVDIYFREDPHPEFGNRYIGLFKERFIDSIMITNADKVEDYEFGMIEDKDGAMWYSQCHHDCLMIDGKMIDGGRQYIRSSGGYVVFEVKDGKFIEKK